MTGLLDRALALAGDIGLILHLGAGSGALLDSPGAARARTIVLVEADPAQTGRLERRIGEREAGPPEVRLIAAAVGTADGTAGFRQFNLQSHSSLRAARDLRQLYPGLRQTGEVQVQVIGIAALLARLPPAAGAGAGAETGAGDVLIVDTPGEEETVIAGLLGAGAMARFASVLLCCGTTEHYAGSVPIDVLGPRLETAGYRLAAQDDEDPDRPTRLYRPDPLWQENRRLAQALAAAEATARQTSAQADARTARIATLEADTAILRKRAETAERAAEAAGERAEALRAAQVRIADLETALADSARKLAASEDEGQRARAAQEAARAESARQSGLVAETETALAAARSAEADLDRQLAVAQADLGLALRMQAVAATDLKDLQARYAEVLTRKESQDRLIAQLALRLEEASDHLRALDMDKPALLPVPVPVPVAGMKADGAKTGGARTGGARTGGKKGKERGA